MATAPASIDSILDATRRAIAEQGPGQITMSAIAAAAGVSRPTLYRWFPTKTELLTAVSAYEERQFDLGLQAAIEAHRTPRRRLDAGLHYLTTYLDESMVPDPVGVDPQFALGSIRASIGPHIGILARLLGDALLEVPAVRAGRLSREAAAELFLRLAYSHFLIPHSDANALLASMRDLAGIPRRQGSVLAG